MNKTLRPIKKIIEGRLTREGAGVHLHRIIGWNDPSEFDPFLLLDDFSSDKPEDYIKGFPWHPHRGIETITYVLKGSVKHEDSTGISGVIGPGDIQWMTAGSGIFHQEMPQGDNNGAMYGFQLWANLPASHKMMGPRYRGLTQQEIPEIQEPGGTRIRVIAGTCQGVAGPISDVVTAPEYLDVSVPAEATFSHPIPEGHTAFVYVFEGEGFFDRKEFLKKGQLGLFGEGDFIEVSAKTSPVRFLLLSGAPLREPIAWDGPIVMNTQKELFAAYEALENGTFVKRKKKPKGASPAGEPS